MACECNIRHATDNRCDTWTWYSLDVNVVRVCLVQHGDVSNYKLFVVQLFYIHRWNVLRCSSDRVPGGVCHACRIKAAPLLIGRTVECGGRGWKEEQVQTHMCVDSKPRSHTVMRQRSEDVCVTRAGANVSRWHYAWMYVWHFVLHEPVRLLGFGNVHACGRTVQVSVGTGAGESWHVCPGVCLVM